MVPTLDEVPVGDYRSAEDSRTFWGFYANDEWTPFRALTLTFGARYDRTSESLDATVAEVGAPAPDVASDSRTDGAWSGGVSALVRIVDKPKASVLNALNLYVSAKSNFKPAAPNILEAESARHPRAGTRPLRRGRAQDAAGRTATLSLDVTFFHMEFENLVVSTVGPDGQPLLTNAGEERFQGMDAELVWALPKLEGWSLAAGYGHHDATYVSFSFLTPDGELRVVDGKRLELVPRDLWNARFAYAPKTGLGFWGAVRHQNIRPLNAAEHLLHGLLLRVGRRARRGSSSGGAFRSSAATSATTATTSPTARSATASSTSRRRGAILGEIAFRF